MCTRIQTRRSRESGPNNGGVKSRWENCDARQSVKDDRNAIKHRIGPASGGREGRGVRLRSSHRHLRFESNFQISQVQQLPSHARGDQRCAVSHVEAKMGAEAVEMKGFRWCVSVSRGVTFADDAGNKE